MLNQSKVVIIGAGQAAAGCIAELRRQAFLGSITVISDEHHFFYERPPLSKAALFQETNDITKFKIFSAQKLEDLNVEVTIGTATEIDRRNQQITVRVMTEAQPTLIHIGYDYLVIATGSTPLIPNPAWKALQNVHTLRSYLDTLALKAKLDQAQNIAFIGGGWISLELAASARKKGLSVTIFERAPRLCIRNLTTEISDYLAALHKKNGTTIHFNTPQVDILEQWQKETLKLTVATPQEAAQYDLVVIGAGVALNQTLALEAGLICNKGIVIDEHGQTNDPAIFAAGDVAQHPTLGTSLQTWANANETGLIAARGILQATQEPAEIPWFWSDQYETNIQILGMSAASDHLFKRHLNEQEAIYMYLNDQNQITQVIAFNQPRFIKQAKRWMKAKKVIDRMQLQDPALDWNKM